MAKKQKFQKQDDVKVILPNGKILSEAKFFQKSGRGILVELDVKKGILSKW